MIEAKVKAIKQMQKRSDFDAILSIALIDRKHQETEGASARTDEINEFD